LLTRLIDRTLEHYDVAWSYTLAIPRPEWRMRLACAWPLLIGLHTLAAIARVPDMLAHPGPIKISRSAVRAIVMRSTVTVLSNHALRREAQRRRAQVVRALQRPPSA
jgi:farnesyl-diphosphate farnesyltransferase